MFLNAQKPGLIKDPYIYKNQIPSCWIWKML